jgi:serine/threonine protein kinase/tetratricopeptide (TPR) repeat protein
MPCSRCGSGAAPLHGRCAQCGASVGSDTTPTAIGLATPLPFPGGDATITPVSDSVTQFSNPDDGLTQLGGTPPAPPPTVAVPPLVGTSTSIQQSLGVTVGHNFGSRYHIIRVLGIGGMGAVYQAWDQTLEVAVALKIIRPESAPDAQTAEALQRRFKHELLLARQVTHKNVVRIHDLGEIDGITYITMPYVHGSDLATVVAREGRLPVERAVAIAKELASGLVAAHAAGVVHRDLKPANIMIDGEGGVLIMDFGIARSTSGGTAAGMTASGVIVGTVEYMAPEQAKGERVDARADIYSFGLILNDILLGRRQSTSSGVAELMSRMQAPLASLRSIDATIPEWLDGVVNKCIQPDPANRYQSMSEVLADLEAKSGRPVTVSTRTATTPAGSRTQSIWLTVAAAALLVTVIGAGWVSRGRLFAPRAPQQQATNVPATSLAVLPFRNASGDVTLDSLGSSLSEVLRTELGQSSHVRTIPSARLHQVLQDLRIAPNATLSPVELERVASFTSARSVLWGQVSRFGNAIRIDATLQDLDRQESVPLNAMAPNESGLLTAIAELASAVRQSLARGSPDVLNELKLTAWKPSTSSFDALRLYNEGLALMRDGKQQAAQKSFEAATKADGNFALAFSGLAQSYSTLGYDTEAGQASRRAMSLGEALPPQEKYLISANHYRIVNDTPKAIEAFENLAKASPNSASVQFDLASLYERSGAFDKARERFAKVVELDPKFVDGLRALGRVEIRRGNPQGSLEHLNAGLTLAIELKNDQARADILQAIGIAYKRLDRPEEALRRFEESLEIKRKLGEKRGMAASLGEIAQAQEDLGYMRESEQSFRESLKLQREIGDKAGISTTLLNLAVLLNENLGRPDDALPLLRESLQIRRDIGNTSGEALVLNNIGSVYFQKGQYSEGQTYFERALEIREKAKVPNEIADTLHNLAETLAKEGRFEQSLARYLRALELRRTSGDRRGAAIESYSIGTIFDDQGRYGAAIKSKEEALTSYRDLKQKDMWLGEILSGVGRSLSLGGRMDDAAKHLDEAMGLARNLNNPTLIAQTTRFQADRLYFAGDIKGANRLAEQASQAASRASDRSLALLAQAQVAMTAAAMQATPALAAKLATLAQDADTLGLKSLAVECTVQRAEALFKLGNREDARREAERAIAQAETFGFRLSLARAHFLRGEALRQSGSAEARTEYSAALRLLDEIKGEEGSQNVATRADFGPMRDACVRWSKTT